MFISTEGMGKQLKICHKRVQQRTLEVKIMSVEYNLCGRNIFKSLFNMCKVITSTYLSWHDGIQKYTATIRLDTSLVAFT